MRCTVLLALVVALVNTESERHIEFLHPQPWGVVQELGENGLAIRVDASQFMDVWLSQGCSLALLMQGYATETDRINATFHMGGGLSAGPHKVGAIVSSYDNEVLSRATLIFIYAPHVLGPRPPVPTPVSILPLLQPPGGRPLRRMVRALLQRTKINCGDRAALVLGLGRPDLSAGVIIDVGSHDGRELVSLAAVARKVIAFEATPSKAVRIEQRLREAGIWHKVVLHPIAASNSTGHVPLHIPDGDNGSEMDSVGSTFYYTRDQRTISVQGGRLDDFVHEPIMLLKLDVQGHELQVLAGAERLLTHHGVDMIVLEFAPKLLMANAVDPALLLHFLYDRGYQCFSCPSANPQATGLRAIALTCKLCLSGPARSGRTLRRVRPDWCFVVIKYRERVGVNLTSQLTHSHL